MSADSDCNSRLAGITPVRSKSLLEDFLNGLHSILSSMIVVCCNEDVIIATTLAFNLDTCSNLALKSPNSGALLANDASQSLQISTFLRCSTSSP